MDNTQSLLDHGYLRLIESWGSDERIIEAARMSTNAGFKGWGNAQKCPRCGGSGRQLDNPDMSECMEPGCKKGTIGKAGDEKLLKYLWENKHTTPFEMAGLTIEVQAPIMVFREWHRHRTQSYNELSARYTPLPPMDYMPTSERCMVMDSLKNKQAGAVGDAAALTHESALTWLEELAALYEHAQRVYEDGLIRGIPKELARLPVTVGRYSRMRASANLWNWLRFLTLRSTEKGPKAQYEIRVYADALAEVVQQLFPRTWELFSATR